jgi:MYXO-CTERM domain-containing protein
MRSVPLQAGGESTLILVGVGLLFVAVLALVGIFAYTEHHKQMALIESGQYAAETVQPAPWVLAVGFILLAVGLADVVHTAWAGTVPGDGLTSAALGLAALAYYWFRRRGTRDSGSDTDAETVD